MNNEVSQKLRLAVKSKLTTLDAYIDDELPDLILVMLARKKDKEHMIDELSDFLETDTTSFVEWVMKLYVKLTGMSAAPTGIGECKNSLFLSILAGFNYTQKGAIPKTIVKKRMDSSDEETKHRRRKSRSPSSSRSSRSSRSSDSSRSRSRTPKKRSDAYHAGGRRRHLDLAKTYRNSSSEGSHSKGLHLRPQKKTVKLKLLQTFVNWT